MTRLIAMIVFAIASHARADTLADAIAIPHTEQGRPVYASSYAEGAIIDALRGVGMSTEHIVTFAGFGSFVPSPHVTYWQQVGGLRCADMVGSHYWTTAELSGFECCGPDMPAFVRGSQPWPCGAEVWLTVRPGYPPTWVPGNQWGPVTTNKWLCEVVDVAANAECECFPCASPGP